MPEPVVGILMGSESDLDVMKQATQVVETFAVLHEIRISSAHRMPEETFARHRQRRGGSAGGRRSHRRLPKCLGGCQAVIARIVEAVAPLLETFARGPDGVGCANPGRTPRRGRLGRWSLSRRPDCSQSIPTGRAGLRWPWRRHCSRTAGRRVPRPQAEHRPGLPGKREGFSVA